jgi:hypothetical protein
VRGHSALWAVFHKDERKRVRDSMAFDAFSVSSSSTAATLSFEIQQHLPPSPRQDAS